MLLVLRRIAGHGLVAELAELDPDFFGGDLIRSVADDGPVALRRGESASGVGNTFTSTEHFAHGLRQRAKRIEELGPTRSQTQRSSISNRTRQHGACGDLRVERFGRGDGHFHVAAVGGVQHAVRLVGQVAASPVDDADDRSPSQAQQVNCAIGVGRGTGLADRNRQRVAHVETHVEARQLCRGDCVDVEDRPGELIEDRCHALPGDGSGALADYAHSSDRSCSQPFDDRCRQRPVADDGA